MSSATRLIDLPDNFLDQEKWAQVRALAPTNSRHLAILMPLSLIALLISFGTGDVQIRTRVGAID